MSKNNISRYKSATRFLYKFIKPHRKWYLLAIAISIIVIGVNMIQIYTTEQLVNSSISGDKNKILVNIIVFVAIVGANVFLTWVSSISIGRLSAFCTRDMKRYITNKLIMAEYSEIVKVKTGDILNTLNSDTGIVTTFISGYFISLFSQVAMTLTAFIYLLTVNPVLCIITFLYTPIGIFFTMNLNKKLNVLYPKSADFKGEALSLVEQAMSCIPVIKSFLMEKRITKSIDNAYKKIYRNDMKISVYRALMQPACYSTSHFPRLIYLIYAGNMVMSGDLTVGTFVAFYGLLEYIIGTTVYLPFMLNSLNTSIASINRINRIEKISQVNKIKEIGKKQLEKSSINVSNISFSYEKSNTILNGLTFNISKNGIYVLKGESGSGKTTLLDLLCGLYKPSIGNIDVCNVDPYTTDISNIISVVLQDIYLFPVSVKENIRYSKLNATNIEVEKASILAGANEFISKLNEGYDTLIGDGNVGLSGGQKQRIALAQAILKDTPIWLLDEPTSALDNETESIVKNTIKHASKNKIIIISSHKKSIIDIADRVINLEREVHAL